MPSKEKLINMSLRNQPPSGSGYMDWSKFADNNPRANYAQARADREELKRVTNEHLNDSAEKLALVELARSMVLVGSLPVGFCFRRFAGTVTAPYMVVRHYETKMDGQEFPWVEIIQDDGTSTCLAGHTKVFKESNERFDAYDGGKSDG